MRWFTVAVAVSLGASCVAQRHPHKREERAEIMALEGQWRQAEVTENVGMMDRLLSDDFLGITAAGQVVTKVQQLDRMRTRQLEMKQLNISDTKIKISGNLAVVTSLAQLDGTSNGLPLRGYFRYTRVYQRLPLQGWKITNFEATKVPSADGATGFRRPAPEADDAAPPAAGASSRPASQGGSGSPQPQS